jgi:hypothetical protein
MCVATTEVNPQMVLKSIQHWEHWETIGHVANKEYGITTEEYQRLLPEYQKFLALIIAGHRGLGMHSEVVDRLWHAHILHTMLYTKFCEAFNGGQMIHHLPSLDATSAADCIDTKCLSKCKTPPPQCIEGDPPGELRPRFHDVYTAIFGPVPAIWGFSEADSITVL